MACVAICRTLVDSAYGIAGIAAGFRLGSARRPNDDEDDALEPSFPRNREGGFTFEVQQISEHLSGCLIVKTLARDVIITPRNPQQVIRAESVEVGFTWQVAPQSADGILDTAFLPGCMRIAKEGFHIE